MTGCEPPVIVEDDDLTGELFALAIQVNAGSIGLNDAMVEALEVSNVNRNPDGQQRANVDTEPAIWRYP